GGGHRARPARGPAGARPRRAHRVPRHHADGRGPLADRAHPRPRPRGRAGQPQHGRRAGRGGPRRRAAAWAPRGGVRRRPGELRGDHRGDHGGEPGPHPDPPEGPMSALDGPVGSWRHGGPALGSWRRGELGSRPVIGAMLVLWLAFQAINPNFLSPDNLVNLSMQMVALGVTTLGVVLVLVAGEIDLSVGAVNGLA